MGGTDISTKATNGEWSAIRDGVVVTPVDVLHAARALLADPARWTQGRNGRMDNGYPVEATDPRATCWCMAGAILLTSNGSQSGDHAAALLTSFLGVDAIYKFNDAPTTTHALVLHAFDRTIARAENE
jgi:hypothetical protein